MTVFILMAISVALLFVPVEFTALLTAEFGTLKFLINIVTHQLAHGGFGHFIGNYMFMVPYAVFLESRLGRNRFLALYFLTGLFAALTQIAGAGSGGLIGSSGAAYGIFAAACTVFNKTKWHRLVAFSILGFALVNQFLLATAPMAGLYGVAFWAHFGGGVSGLALMQFFGPSQSSQSKSDLK